MTAAYRHLVSKGSILLLALALLATLLVARPIGAQESNPIEYAENGTDPVATFTGVDPEGRPVYWSLLEGLASTPEIDDVLLIDADIADHGDFSISTDGVLTFKSPPSFESPNGGQLEDAETTPGSNTYNVVVVSSDDAPGATTDGELPDTTERSNFPKMSYHKVTVEVTDVDEDGSVSLSTLQPQAGIALNIAGTANTDDDAAAALKDQDASPAQINAAKWKWEQSSAMDGPWTLISGETDPSYTPAADVAGMYLRLTATYNDKHDDDKTAMATSAYPVRKAPPGGNSAPVFSAGETDTRRVKENSPSGTAVGKPVTAGDAGDVLTYTLAGDDASSFSIDRASGQIMTKASLNLEAGLTDRDADTDGIQLQVTVRATDPYGDPAVATADVENSDTIIVDITVENVNESPTMTVGPTRDSQAENEDADTDAEGRQIPILNYTATDVDVNDAIRWTLEGADKDAFKVTPGTADTDLTDGVTLTATLAFEKSPNFEKPIDANKDNVYMVTVVATDKKKLTATRDVVITVTNADDTGVITFSSEQPKVRIDFTASLTDEDGGVKDVKWQWAASTNADCPDATFAEDGSDNIDKAKSDTYTPVTSPTTNVDQCLQATATYTDSDGSGKAMSATSANPVVDNLDNALPEFKEGGDKPVTQAVRYIVENADADANVVVALDGMTASTETPSLDPVMATDPNGGADVLTYTLGGRDKDSFAIASDTGQITVKTGTKVDYEKKKSYMVTVTAKDPSQASATIDVTINVVNVNEGPVIAGEDDITKEFGENSTSTIQTFSATDPEKRPVYWSLKGDDTDYPDDDFFTISTRGALSFKEGRDFENPLGGGNSNTYKVVVIASDDAPDVGTPIMTSERKFTVRVTNVREPGSVTVDRRVPQVGVSVTAALTDGDATSTQIGAAAWQWYKGSTAISGETAASFTPSEAGSHKVEATYTAKDNTETASKTISVRAVPTGTNAAPVFKNDDEARSVDENKANVNVGNRVTATDPGDTLTYLVSPNTHFSIDNNGQLKTKVALDHEDPPDLSLTVTATDPSDASDTVIVTVAINDVNEAPTIATGPTRAEDWPENKAIAEAVATYTPGADPEGDDLVWKLTGSDATDFNIGNQEGGTPGTLTFKEMPDYEKPAASNNLYRVTVEVSDGKLKDTRPMTVTVTDVEEEGEVELSTVAPRVAVELTASLEDSDGGEKDVTWQWWKSVANDDLTAPDFLSDGDPNTTNWTEIDDAESDTYEPVKDDLGRWLIARASYSDRRGEGKTAMGVSDNAVRVNNDNRAPMFKENDVEITETTRKVAENTPNNEAADDGTTTGIDESTQGNIDTLVMAEDPNEDKLTYTLGGPDAVSFNIGRSDGQLSTKAKLDYEDKSRYMVTVTATDPHGLSDSVDVTIMVTDVDEAPVIMVGGLAITGKGAIDYPENGTDDVATYSAVGPDSASATWSLSGADAGDFRISSAGVLTFRTSPDYETKSTYMVTVNANDGENMAMKAVTITVTDVDDTTSPGGTLLDRYDADDNGSIQKGEMIAAINDYLFGTGATAITKGQMIEVINLYLFG